MSAAQAASRLFFCVPGSLSVVPMGGTTATPPPRSKRVIEQKAYSAPLAFAKRVGLRYGRTPSKEDSLVSEHESFGRRSANFAAELNHRSEVNKTTSAQTINCLLGSSAGINTASDKAEFARDVAHNRRRIRSVSRRTFSPHSRLIRGWDAIIALALVFTAFVTPFEVGFLSSNASSYEGPINFTLNRVVE